MSSPKCAQCGRVMIRLTRMHQNVAGIAYTVLTYSCPKCDPKGYEWVKRFERETAKAKAIDAEIAKGKGAKS